MFSKTLPKFTKADRSGRSFQTEYTFPTKVDGFDVIAKLKEFNDLPDSVLCWEIINTEIRKGPKPPMNVRGLREPTPGADPEPQILTDEEMAKIPPNTVVRIYIIQHTPPGIGRANDPGNEYSQEDMEYDTNIEEQYNRSKPPYLSRRLKNDLNQLISGLNHFFFSEEGERYITNTNEPAGAIPNKIQVLSATQYPKNPAGQSQLALNYGKPYHGFWFMAGTRFHAPKPEGELMGTNFNTTKRGGNQNDKDGLVSFIPNSYPDSALFPKIFFQEKVTEMTSNNMMAFMYNGLYTRGVKNQNNVPANFGSGGVSFNPPTYEFQKLNGTNTKGKSGGDEAYTYNYEFYRYMYNSNTILLNDFIRNARTGRTNKLLNPEKLPFTLSYPVDTSNTKQITASSLAKDIPLFMVQFLDPTNPECSLHQGNRPTANITTDEQRLNLFKEHLETMCRGAIESLESGPFWFKLENTDGYAAVKLNVQSNTIHWDYELFTSNPQLIKTKDKEKWNFVNNFHETDVDILINSRYTLDVYGTKFDLKGRSFAKDQEIDIGLEVKPIEDEKQSIAAQWYSVHLNWGDVDVIQTIVETPKELVKYSAFNPYEREKLIRELGMRYDEYLYDTQMIDLQKQDNKFMKTYEDNINYMGWKYAMGRSGMLIVGGLLGTAENIMSMGMMGKLGKGLNLPKGAGGYYSYDRNRDESTNVRHPHEVVYSRWGRLRHGLTQPYREYLDMYSGRGRPPRDRRYGFLDMGSANWRQNWEALGNYGHGFSDITSSVSSIVEGGLMIGHAYDKGYYENERIKFKFELTETRLANEGDIMNKQYEYDKQNLLMNIYLQSANTIRPPMNRNLVYKLYNRENNLNDVHMTVFYPGGKLAEYLKAYYEEYGYQIFEKDFICTGADSIQRHLRYEFIYEINHPNESIKELIKSRALMGIKMVRWVQ